LERPREAQQHQKADDHPDHDELPPLVAALGITIPPLLGMGDDVLQCFKLKVGKDAVGQPRVRRETGKE
jgi:hypothetical protein